MFALKSTRRALMAGLACIALSVPLSVGAQAKEASSPTPKMWVIRDADSTIYLFGSIHLLKSDTQWRHAGIDAAFQSADTLYLEVDNIDDQAAAGALLMKYGMDPEKGLLKPYTPKELELIRATFKARGLDVDQLVVFKPWVAGLLLVLKQVEAAGFNGELGVDKAFLADARKKGLPVKGLETMEDQMIALSAGSAEDQAKGLLLAVEGDAKAAVTLNDMLAAWLKGDTKTLEKLIVDETKKTSPEMYDKLFTQRNQKWVGQVQTILAGSGTQFIVVGAGHLTGPDSLQKLLAKAGVTAEVYNYQMAK